MNINEQPTFILDADLRDAMTIQPRRVSNLEQTLITCARVHTVAEHKRTHKYLKFLQTDGHIDTNTGDVWEQAYLK